MIDRRHPSEAEAVRLEALAASAEAYALQEETELYIATFQGPSNEESEAETDAEAEARMYRRFLDTAGHIVEISYGVQAPLQDDPYKTLGSEIMGPARHVLEVIEDFGDDTFTPAPGGRLSPADGIYEALKAEAKRLVQLCYEVQDPVRTSIYAPLGAEIAERAMTIYQMVNTFTEPALTTDN